MAGMNFLLPLALVGLLSACAMPIRYLQPSSTLLDSPESLGRGGKIRLGLQSFTTPRAQVTPDLSVQDPAPKDPRLENVHTGALLIGVSAVSHFDVELRMPGTEARAKWQILGESRDEAEEGNLSLAVSGALGIKTETGTQDTYPSNSTSTQKASYSDITYTGALSVQVGYRFTDWFLAYAGAMARGTYFNGEFSVPVRSIQSAGMHGSLFSFGPALGLEFGNDWIAGRVGATYLHASSENTSNDYISTGAEIAFTLGRRD